MLVSIVLPTLNRFDGFVNTIQDLINQTYSNIEIIAIDDGSPEDIYKKKKNYIKALDDKRIQIYRNEDNKKIPYTINRGFKISNGEYITWVSDDNTYYSNFIDILVDKTGNSDFTYSGYIMKFKTGKTRHIFKKYNHLKDMIYGFMGLAAFMFSKRLFEKIGYYDESLHGIEDYEYLLRIFLRLKTHKDITTNCYNGYPVLYTINGYDSVSNQLKQDMIIMKRKIQNSFIIFL